MMLFDNGNVVIIDIKLYSLLSLICGLSNACCRSDMKAVSRTFAWLFRTHICVFLLVLCPLVLSNVCLIFCCDGL